jgi:hypothetical protein
MLSDFAHFDHATCQIVIKLNYVNQTFSLEVYDDRDIKILKQAITKTEQILEKKLEPGAYMIRILENNIITREQRIRIPSPTGTK